MSAPTTSLICSRLPCTTVSMLSRKRSAIWVAEPSSSGDTRDLRRAGVDRQPMTHWTLRRARRHLDCTLVVHYRGLFCKQYASARDDERARADLRSVAVARSRALARPDEPGVCARREAVDMEGRTGGPGRQHLAALQP